MSDNNKLFGYPESELAAIVRASADDKEAIAKLAELPKIGEVTAAKIIEKLRSGGLLDEAEEKPAAEPRKCACGCGKELPPDAKPGWRFRSECLEQERTTCIFEDCDNPVEPGHRYCDKCHTERVKGRCGECGEPSGKHALCRRCHRESKGWTRDKRKSGKDRRRKGPRKCRECNVELPADHEHDRCDNCHRLARGFVYKGRDGRTWADRVGDSIVAASAKFGKGDKNIAAAATAAMAAVVHYEAGDAGLMEASLYEAEARVGAQFLIDRLDREAKWNRKYPDVEVLLDQARDILEKDAAKAKQLVDEAKDKFSRQEAQGLLDYADEILKSAREYDVDLGEGEKSLRVRVDRVIVAIKKDLEVKRLRARRLRNHLGDLRDVLRDIRETEAYQAGLEKERAAEAVQRRKQHVAERREHRPVTSTLADIAGVSAEDLKGAVVEQGEGKTDGGRRKPKVQKKERTLKPRRGSRASEEEAAIAESMAKDDLDLDD